MCMSFVERVLLEAKAVAIEECLCAQQGVDGHHVGGAAFLAKDQNTVLHHLPVVFAVVGIVFESVVECVVGEFTADPCEDGKSFFYCVLIVGKAVYFRFGYR